LMIRQERIPEGVFELFFQQSHHADGDNSDHLFPKLH
jgi:hypothetical protein